MTELRGHHIIPQGVSYRDLLANRYVENFGGSLSQARVWVDSVIDSPINLIPLPNRAGSGVSLPEHTGGHLSTYQTGAIGAALQRIDNAATPQAATDALLDLAGAMRIGIIDGDLGPNNARFNALNESFLTDINIENTVSVNRAKIDAFKALAASATGATDWAVVAMGLTDTQLQQIMQRVQPGYGRSGDLLTGVAAAAEARGLALPAGHNSWESYHEHVGRPNARVRFAVNLFKHASLPLALVGVMAVPILEIANRIVAKDGVSLPDALRQMGLDPATIDIPALVAEVAVDLLVPGGALKQIVEIVTNIDDLIAVAELYAEAYPNEPNVQAFAEFVGGIRGNPLYSSASDALAAARERAGNLFRHVSDFVFGGSHRNPYAASPVHWDGNAISVRVHLGGGFYTGPANEIVVVGQAGALGPESFEPFDGDPSTYDGRLLPANVVVSGAGFSVYDLTFTLDGREARPIFSDLDPDGVPQRFDADSGVMLDGVVKPPVAYVVDLGNGLVEVHWAVGPNAGQVEVVEGGVEEIVSRTTEIVEGRQSGVFIDDWPVSFGQLGSIFGSNLARLIETDDPWEALGVGTLLGTIGLNIGQGFENAFDGADTSSFGDAFTDLPSDLLAAGVGAVSSYLFAELVNDLGIEGFGGGLVNSTGGAVVGQIANNLLQLSQGVTTWTNPATNATETLTWKSGVNSALLLQAAGGFIGTWLASELVEFDTVGGQIGASIGAAGGTIAGWKIGLEIGGKVGGFYGAIIGAFIGYIFGGVIGTWFGSSPKSGAYLGWNEADQEFRVTRVWAKGGASKDGARSMATQVADLVNSVIDSSGSRVLDAQHIRIGGYDTKKSRMIYKQSASHGYAYESKDPQRVVTHGQFLALYDLSSRLAGGDVYIKRALAATLEMADGSPNQVSNYAAGSFEVQTLLGNIATASDYVSYLQNASVINALIAAEPLSAFTAGWTITFARVIELGLDRRWASDWTGGWNVFLDETADGLIDGVSFSPANVALELDSETHERLFAFFDESGAILGVLGDTIDTASKDIIIGTAAADNITVTGDVAAIGAGVLVNGADTLVARNALGEIPSGSTSAWGGDVFITGGDLPDGRYAVAEGDEVSFKLKAAAFAEGLTLQARIVFYDANGVALSTYGPSVEETATQWKTLTGEAFAAPAGAVSYALQIMGVRADGDVNGGFDFGLRDIAITNTPVSGAASTWRSDLADASFASIGSLVGGAGYARTIETIGDNVGIPGDHTIRVAALIDGGEGDDVIIGGDSGNDLIGGAGNDVLIGGKLDDWLIGGDGDDKLFAGAVADPNATNETLLISATSGNGDYLEGGDGNDKLYGGKGSDWLSGGAGIDKLLGGAGGDILDAGEGDDHGASGEAYLLGGSGSDQYVFYYGAGDDVIYDAGDAALASSVRTRLIGINAGTTPANWAGGGVYETDGSIVGGEDAIAFGPGITFRDLVLRRSETGGQPGDDLIIDLMFTDENDQRVATGDSLTIQDWFDPTHRVEWLRFADGEEIRIGDITTFIQGTDAADVVIGTYGSDFLLGGDGDDEMWGLAGDDFAYGGKGRDFISGDSNNDWVVGGEDDDQVMGGLGNDTVFGDGGNDFLYGGDGHDLLSGGRGGDWVVGGAGDDVIRFSRGDGKDVLFDAYVDNWDLVYSGGAYVNGYALDGQGRVAKDGAIYWQDGVWIGLYDWNDAAGELRRHKGVDSNGRLTANSGDDTLEFGLGIEVADVQLRRVGLDLVLAIGASAEDASAFSSIADQITLKEWFAIDGKQIEQFVFVDIGALDTNGWTLGSASTTDGDDMIAGGAGSDWITGGLGDDEIAGDAGDDILSGNEGGDHLSGGAGADILYGGGADDVLDGGAGADQLFGGSGEDIASYASNVGTGLGIRVSLADGFLNTLDAKGDIFSSIEGLEGTSRADRLIGDGGDNLLRGLAGDDLLQGGAGDDSYEIEAGDGADVIDDRPFDVEHVLLSDGTLNSALFEAVWEELPLYSAMGVNWYAYRLVVTRISDDTEIYRSRDNVDFLYTSEQENAPAGGAWPFANGQWKQGAYRTGNAVETIVEVSRTQDGGDDVIEIGEGVSLADLTAAWENDDHDLRINIAGGGSLLIKSQDDAAARVESLFLFDGVTGDLTKLKLAGDTASDDGDFFLGGAIDDAFTGGIGDDVISGGAGVDTLSGGAGDDIIEGGAGADILDGGDDSVTLDHAALSEDPGSNYGDTLRYVGSSAGVSINLGTNAASGGDAEGDVISNFENVVGSAFADTLTGDDGANRLAGLAGDDVMSGGLGDDVLSGGDGADQLYGGDGADAIAGDAGDDLIYGDAGADIIAGGDGDDEIHAGADDDIVDAGAGADIVHGDAGKDQLVGGAGDDQIFGEDDDDILAGDEGDDLLDGGAGADKLVGGLGDDALQGGLGDDAYVFDANSGSDIIIDADGENTLTIAGIGTDQIWIARSGDDLKIGVIGGDTRITLQDYYAASSATRMKTVSVATPDGALMTLYLAKAEALIALMGVNGVSPPASMPSVIADTLSTYWHLDGKAAPSVVDQDLTTAEDVALTGSVGAEDHDDNIASYSLEAAPDHGAVDLDLATGAWTYTPDADYYGVDGFTIRVTDADGQSVTQQIALTVTSQNDAPRAISSSGPLEVGELAADGAIIATFDAEDVDSVVSGLFFELIDDANGAFRLDADGTLVVNRVGVAGVDYEAASSHVIRIRVTDSNGASYEQDFTVSVTEENEAPTDISLAAFSPDRKTYSFLSLYDNGGASADGLIHFGLEAPSGTGSLSDKKFLIVEGDGDGSGESGETGYVAGGFGNDGTSDWINSLAANGAEDPIKLSAFGMYGTDTVNDLTNYLRFNAATGFGLGNWNEGAPQWALFNSGDSIDFAAQSVDGAPRVLRTISFTVQVANGQPSASIGLDVDGSLIAVSSGSFVSTAAASFTAGHGALVVIDVVAQTLSVDGVAQSLPASFWTAFEAAGGDNITLGATLAETNGFSLADVVITTDEAPPPPDAGDSLVLEENNLPGAVIGRFDGFDPDGAIDPLSFSLSDDAGGRFAVTATGELSAVGTLDYEAGASYTITVRATDRNGLYVERNFEIGVIDVNEAPAALMFENAITSLDENTDTAAAIKIADLTLTDDALGGGILALTGVDAENFVIVEGALYLKAGVLLDFESQSAFEVSVTIDDPSIGTGVDLSQDFTLNIGDINEAPTDLSLTLSGNALVERDRIGDDAAPGVYLGKLSGVDPDLAASGAYAALAYSVDDARFEILNGDELWLKSGIMADLDYETSQSVTITVTVKDLSGGAGAYAFSRSFTFAIADRDDVLIGTVNADALTGQSGRDRLYGQSGDDTLLGGAGADDLYGGAGADALSGGDGADLLEGEADNDVLQGGAGADTLRGGAGADQLYGDADDDVLEGGDGDDLLEGGAGADTLTGGTGVDTLSYAGSSAGVNVNLASGVVSGGDAQGDVLGDGFERLTGSAFADTLTGTANAEAIYGGAGDDVIQGGDGGDKLYGGAGADTITGGAGGDEIYGEAGDDILHGGDGADELYGGDGDDELYAEGDGDLLDGGAGNDILEGGLGSDEYVIGAHTGDDIIREFDPSATDVDKLNVVNVDAANLWFERVGDDLKITVIGGTSTVRIEDWYANSPNADLRVEFFITEESYTRDVDVDALVALMASETKPANQADLDALMADTLYESQWAAYWDVNNAPDFASIASQTTQENQSISIALSVSDDFTSVEFLHFSVLAYNDAALTQANTSLLNPTNTGVTVTGGVATLNLALAQYRSGSAYIAVQATDLTGRAATQVFTLEVSAVATAPTISVAQATGTTLDSGTLALNIQAALADTDGSETLEVQISGVPTALALNQGTNLGGGVWSLTAAQLSGLALTGPADYADDVSLTVSAIAHEGATTATQTTTLLVPINARPTDITASGVLSVSENASNGSVLATLSGVDPDGAGDIASIALVDDAGGRFALSGAGELSVANGALLNYEAASAHQVQVRVTDSGGLAYTKTFTVSLTDLNEAPTGLEFASAVTSLVESASTASAIKLADIVYSDDALGVETLALSGADATNFEIIGGALYLKAGVNLDYETKPSYSVTVTVDDPTIGSTPELSRNFVLTLSDSNDPPSAINFANALTSLVENTSTAARIKIADILVVDDALGQANLSLAGADAASFELIGAALYLKAGVALNFETKSAYSVVVRADDPSIGTNPDVTRTFNLTVTDVNEAPTALAFANAFSVLHEDESTEDRVKLADLVVTDDALGTNGLAIDAAFGDASAFEILGTALYLKAGVALDYETKNSYQVRVKLDDPSVGTSPDAQQVFTLSIADVNEAPTNLTFQDASTSIAEDVSTATRIHVADIAYDDDGLGAETITISGADAEYFELDGNALYLKAGVQLDFEDAQFTPFDPPPIGPSSVTMSALHAYYYSIAVSSLEAVDWSATPNYERDVTNLNYDTTGSVYPGGPSDGFADRYTSTLYVSAPGIYTFYLRSDDGGALYIDDERVINMDGTHDDILRSVSIALSSGAHAFEVRHFDHQNRTTLILDWAGPDFGRQRMNFNPSSPPTQEPVATPTGRKEFSVTVSVDDPNSGELVREFILETSNVDEAPNAPTFAQNSLTLWTNENEALAPNTVIKDLDSQDVQFFAVDPEGGALKYEIVGGDGASKFFIDDDGKLRKFGELNYEESSAYLLDVRAWDGGAIGEGNASPITRFAINVVDVNEAPVIRKMERRTGVRGGMQGYETHYIDKDGGEHQHDLSSVSIVAIDQITNGGTATLKHGGSHSGYWWDFPNGGWIAQSPSASSFGTSGIFDLGGGAVTGMQFRITVRTEDVLGVVGYSYLWYASVTNISAIAPVVFDLGSDGLDLVAFGGATAEFDADGDGAANKIGWVEASDAILTIDLDGDGVVSSWTEIAFSDPAAAGYTDLEGLRAYDSNENGFLDTGDAQFADFRLWRDLNQDAVSDAGELFTLAALNIQAINLTLNLTGQSAEGATDNVLYGTTQYVRTDGTTGTVGDVFLAYETVELSIEILDGDSDQLPPIVFDLDGDGVQLTSRLQSSILFDAASNGAAVRTGWFSAGDGVLALDRNGDGLINNGLEISFTQDLAGAATDLEGLIAYDSNQNGFFDSGDARFGEFLIWQDANQDGVSQASELKSLADWNINALNLTSTPTGQTSAGANDNVIHGLAEFVRGDGSIGQAADVSLSYDGQNPETPAPASSDSAAESARLAADQLRERLYRQGWGNDLQAQLARREGRFRFDQADPAPEALPEAAIDASIKKPRSIGASLFDFVFGKQPDLRSAQTSDPIAEIVAEANTRSSLHQGLGVADKKVLGMIDAMAQFDAQTSADLSSGRAKRDPKVAELLTSLPDIRQG